jgi:hypothetical protein
MTTAWTVGADAADPPRLARFWALALGYVIEEGFDEPDNTSIVDPEGLLPAIGFLKVPEPKTSKNRFHVDLRVAQGLAPDVDREALVRAKVAELVAAGATEVREELYGTHLGHVVMLDPEGNEFCVA